MLYISMSQLDIKGKSIDRKKNPKSNQKKLKQDCSSSEENKNNLKLSSNTEWDGERISSEQMQSALKNGYTVQKPNKISESNTRCVCIGYKKFIWSFKKGIFLIYVDLSNISK